MKKYLKLFRRKSSLFIVSLLALSVWLIWGNLHIQVTNIIVEDKNIPEEFDGFKIAQISDLHGKDWGNKLVNQIIGENPDIIVITGDLIDSKTTDLYSVHEFISDIEKMAPIYFVTGNHEARNEYYDELAASLLDQGVNILDDDKQIIKVNEDEILLFGIQDPSFSKESNLLNENEGIVESKIEQLTKNYNGYKILLSHRPEFFDAYVRENINLVFSGHAHGGQGRLPFIGGLVAPDQGFFPKYTSGKYEENNTNMLVSRGLGNSIIPIRMNNNPELLVAELKYKK
ncbi:metallophosphoesterase [Salipaludibacillus sp. LMS25]|jgi:predicted MPP superfamily phosphohydrolase|uniref:metallophosphoesterase n=1 Tax=Salipaludibacillus sp. LMS25 TaxID=2924031 RepID=UPI0020D19F4D|nr:metallophosphoesterase [Salipaludibacillus sp. LMS25]UTR13313.1 metallophosphoesterase [Salipaludibacillus sp. LMS25]